LPPYIGRFGATTTKKEVKAAVREQVEQLLALPWDEEGEGKEAWTPVLEKARVVAKSFSAYLAAGNTIRKAALEGLRRASEILHTESKWDREDDRVCHEEDTTWSLFCALQKASIEVLGEHQHRRVSLQEVRFAIVDTSPGEQNPTPTARFQQCAVFR